MKYISTRGGIEPIDFSETVLMGLAQDGGLILPAEIPDVTGRLSAWRVLSYQDLAREIMALFVDIPDAELRRLVAESYRSFRHPEITPVVQVGNVHVLELFHGPTLAFKDVALQLLGNLFEHVLKQRKAKLNILAATSGDTGSAAICGVRGRHGISIFVMHPHNRVSELQERQMTTVLDPNVFNIAIDGTFDDCQKIMKTLFNDLDFKKTYSLGSVNSINWARVLAQIVYYFYSAFRVMERTGAAKVRFSVPTGNFGDILAGYIASRMGLPVGRLVLATNENDILARFFNTGEYGIGKVHATISPSMDIQVASNFERYLYYRAGEDSDLLSAMMREFSEKGRISVQTDRSGGIDPLFAAGTADTAATLSTISEYYAQYKYLLDPHSAVGVHVGSRHLDRNEPMICLATAHPAKFEKAVRDAIGQDIARHEILERLRNLPTRCAVLPSSAPAVKDFMRKNIGGTSAF